MNIRKRIQSTMRDRIRARRDTAHLFEQPDHILRDIGVCRSELSATVYFGGTDILHHQRR
jgi:uncharacterized protein YjiS (DUF1127 family)